MEWMPERDQEMQENGQPERAMYKASRRGSQARAGQRREGRVWRLGPRAREIGGLEGRGKGAGKLSPGQLTAGCIGTGRSLPALT